MTAKLNNNKVNKPLKIVNKSKVLKKGTTKVQKLHKNEDTKKGAKLKVKIVDKSLKVQNGTKKVKKTHVSETKPMLEGDEISMKINTLNKTIKDATSELIRMGYNPDCSSLNNPLNFTDTTNVFNKIQFSHKSRPSNHAHKRYGTEPRNHMSRYRQIIAFMRVNTLVKSMEDATEEIIKMGFVHVKEVYTTYEEYIAALRNLKPNEFIMDFTVKNLIAFNRQNINILTSDSEKRHWLLSSYKIDSLATLFLELKPGSIVLNLVGNINRAILMADDMNNLGRIYVIDTNVDWFIRNSETIKLANASCVKILSANFMLLENNDIEYILFHGRNLKTLGTLRMFLLHALRKFPNLKRIVFIGNGDENEFKPVIFSCLKEVENNFELIDPREILKNTCLKFNERFVVTSHQDDFCQGFFAVIDRCTQKKTDNELKVSDVELDEVDEASDDKGEIGDDDDEEEASDDDEEEASDDNEEEASDDDEKEVSDDDEEEASNDEEEKASDDDDVEASDNEEVEASDDLNSEDNIEELLKLISTKKTPKSVKTNQKPESINGSTKSVKNNSLKKNNSNKITEANNRLSKKPFKKNNLNKNVAEVVKRKIKNSGEHASKKLKK